MAADRPPLTMPTPAELQAWREQENARTGTVNGFQIQPDGTYKWVGPVQMDPRLQQRIDYANAFYDPKTGKYLGDPSKMPLAAKLILGGTLGVAGGMALAPLFAGGGAASAPSTLGGASSVGPLGPMGYGAGTTTGLTGGASVGTVGTGVPAGFSFGTPLSTAGFGPAAAAPSLSTAGLSVLPSSGVPSTTQAMTTAGLGPAPRTAPAWLKFLDKYKEPIGQGIAGLGDYFSGRTASNAAKEAAAIQAASGERALQEVKGAYAPYMNVGQSAITTLGALSGLPVGGGAGAGPIAPGAANTAQQRPSAQAEWYRHLVGPDGTPRSRQPNVPETKADQMAAGQQQTQSGYGQAAMVRVQAPDGRILLVPRTMVNDAIQNGGQVLGPGTGGR